MYISFALMFELMHYLLTAPQEIPNYGYLIASLSYECITVVTGEQFTGSLEMPPEKKACVHYN